MNDTNIYLTTYSPLIHNSCLNDLVNKFERRLETNKYIIDLDEPSNFIVNKRKE